MSPSIDSLNELIDAAERLSPGFADEFYLALAGHVDLNTLVHSLGGSELSTLLILVSNRLGELLPKRQKTLMKCS